MSETIVLDEKNPNTAVDDNPIVVTDQATDTEIMAEAATSEVLADADLDAATAEPMEPEAATGEVHTEADWGAAMAEQTESETATDEAHADADWGVAMAEQAKEEMSAEQKADDDWGIRADHEVFGNAPKKPEAAAFRDFGGPGSNDMVQDIDFILDIPVQLTVELGRARIAIKNLLQLAQGSVVELDGLAGEPMDVLVNGCLIAQGEVVVVNDKFGIRLTDVVTPAERIRKLNR